MAEIIGKLIEASPYLAFLLIYMWLEERKYQKRVENATTLESRRETHEKEMEARRLAHEKDMNTLWASYIQQLVNEIKTSHQILMNKLDEHEEESEKRYSKIGLTQDILKERRK